MVNSHVLVADLLRSHKIIIPTLELLHLFFFIGKRLHHPDSRQAILNLAVNLRNLLPVALKRLAHLPVKDKCEHSHNRNKCKRHESKPYIHSQKDGKRANNLNHRDDQILRSMVEKLTDVEQVAGNPGQEMTYLLVIIERKSQLLIMPKNIPAHIRLHLRTHDMPKIRNIKIAENL